jgi:hypothetical protein
MTPTRTGAIVISITAQVTFFLALAAACALAYYKAEYTLLTAMAGVAATNATTVVGYWVGSSDGSAKKTDLMAANPPPTPIPAAVEPATVTRTATVTTTPLP